MNPRTVARGGNQRGDHRHLRSLRHLSPTYWNGYQVGNVGTETFLPDGYFNTLFWEFLILINYSIKFLGSAELRVA